MFGIDFFYSAHSPAVSLALLQEAGFAIKLAEVDDPSSRSHLVVLCRKPAHTLLSAARAHQSRSLAAAARPPR